LLYALEQIKTAFQGGAAAVVAVGMDGTHTLRFADDGHSAEDGSETGLTAAEVVSRLTRALQSWPPSS
jgi:hypothetical protein